MQEIGLENGMTLPIIGLGANGIWGGSEAKDSNLAKKQYDIYCYV